MTLTELFKNIANAIREKKGTTEPIVAEDFPEEIESIEAGGKTKLLDGTRFTGSTFSTFKLSDFDISDLTSFYNFFSSCYNLISVDFSGVDTNNITNMSNTFSSCTLLTSLNLSGIDTSNVTLMRGTFGYCSDLISIDVSNFDTSKVTRIDNVFTNCSNLVNLDISNWNLSNVGHSYTQSMFLNCTSLSNDSLKSIIKSMATFWPDDTSASSNKTLSRIGLTQAQANICTQFSEWQTLVNKGWVTGY